ncbi:MAG: helicase [Rickettsiales bacterium]|nr:helicase [Rickettsiales bacterium]
MQFEPNNPLIVQGDGSLLLEVDCEQSEAVRSFLARFAELERAPEHIHTYRITSLFLWNAASAGMSPKRIADGLRQFSKYDVPNKVVNDIEEKVSRFGKVVLLPPEADAPDMLRLQVDDLQVARKIATNKAATSLCAGAIREGLFRVPLGHRGTIKQALLKLGYPVEDLAGFVEGAPLAVELRAETRAGKPFNLRRYQRQAVDAWHKGGELGGGHGVVVLPCGAGKTIVGLAGMAATGCQTLILATGTASVRQWIHEILERTSLSEEQVGEFSGARKEIRPVTVTTYQILTHRRSTDHEFTHMGLFSAANWGLIVYDEVHLLPAPVFRVTADIQARRRLGLTATLVREDGREADVFSLIGPKRFDVPWKDLERKGFVAEARCVELRVDLIDSLTLRYEAAEKRQKVRIAAENPAKMVVIDELLKKHRDDKVLIIGMYLDQLQDAARVFGAPLITGKTPAADREQLYEEFRQGSIRVLVVSKVANFSIDLPDANVAIQISGTFGSRQEEAQRLGRILRPSGGKCWFYSVVTHNSREQEFAHNRQLFLTEQGYTYEVREWTSATQGDSTVNGRPA